MKIKVGDTSFKMKLISRKQYDKTMDENTETDATFDPVDKTITFCADVLDFPNVVRHELFHAYYSMNLVNSSNLDSVQTEELCAEIVGKYGLDIITQSKKITTWIKKRLPNVK